MPEFLKLWRRRFGVVTLLLALPFMVGWVRSVSCFDWLHINVGKVGQFLVMSQGHLLGVQCSYGPNVVTGGPILDWGSGNHSGLVDLLADDRINWTVRIHGCGLGSKPDDADIGVRYEFEIVPYWSIIIPLTLLSAWLLLSKSRAAKKAKPSQPLEPDYA